VVTSQTATLWRALRLLDVAQPVRGYGRLLAG
jgi:maleate cis-trans isomerase